MQKYIILTVLLISNTIHAAAEQKPSSGTNTGSPPLFNLMMHIAETKPSDNDLREYLAKKMADNDTLFQLRTIEGLGQATISDDLSLSIKISSKILEMGFTHPDIASCQAGAKRLKPLLADLGVEERLSEKQVNDAVTQEVQKLVSTILSQN